MGNIVNFFDAIGPVASILLGVQCGYCIHLFASNYYDNRKKDSDKSKNGPSNLPAAGAFRRA